MVFALSLGIAFPRGKQACGQQTKHEVHYDDGGAFRTTLDVPGTERTKIAGESREFIWDHWIGHKRARLRIVGQTIEGQFKTHNIVIEPDSQGHWHIRDEVQGDVRRGVQPAKLEVTVDEYDQVRRTDVNSEQTIPDSEKRAPQTYKLLLTNGSKGIRWLL